MLSLPLWKGSGNKTGVELCLSCLNCLSYLSSSNEWCESGNGQLHIQEQQSERAKKGNRNTNGKCNERGSCNDKSPSSNKNVETDY